MKTTYSEAFIEQALVKIFSRGSRTVGRGSVKQRNEFSSYRENQRTGKTAQVQ